MNDQPLDDQVINNQSLNDPRFLKQPPPRRTGKPQRSSGFPWSLMVMLVAHGVAGLLLSVFKPPFWVWPLGFVGTFIQAILLAGPMALSSLGGWRILLCRWGTCMGVAMSVVALAVAVGYGGTNDIDAIRFGATGLALALINIGVLLLSALCSLLIARTGDQLLPRMGRLRCSMCVLSFCFLGLFLGGATGLLIAG
ncbi:MAG: hypothetical protein AAGC54_12375 [Cyanobacteria bacterium P01_F01_bin.4]